MEITIEKGLYGLPRIVGGHTGHADEVAGEAVEICLQGDFIKGQIGGLQKAILEIVQIEHGCLLVEHVRREEALLVEPFGTLNLKMRQEADDAGDKGCFTL